MTGVSITVRVATIDRFRKSRTFRTLAGAQKFAQRYVGETPELGSHYAVCADGIAKVTASVPVADLFPKLKDEADTDHLANWYDTRDELR